jgi:hypothetical protein
MKNILFAILFLCFFSCQKEKPILSTINPEIMSFIKKYNDVLGSEGLGKDRKYVICAHIENRFDTVKVYVQPLNNYKRMMNLGEPDFEDDVDNRKVYIYAPQLRYLYPNKPKIKIDQSYFSKTDTTIGCMIANFTLRRLGRDSSVVYTPLYDSPISIKLLPPPPPPPLFTKSSSH